MSQPEKPLGRNPLLEMERAVHAEAREWERQRLEEKLQKEADRVGKVFPLNQRKAQQRRETVVVLRTRAGVIKIPISGNFCPDDVAHLTSGQTCPKTSLLSCYQVKTTC